ncbi:hypothetical protein SZ66_22400 [Pantoea ananatis]|nr:hypothetical protein [Pantoea ananatis]
MREPAGSDITGILPAFPDEQLKQLCRQLSPETKHPGGKNQLTAGRLAARNGGRVSCFGAGSSRERYGQHEWGVFLRSWLFLLITTPPVEQQIVVNVIFTGKLCHADARLHRLRYQCDVEVAGEVGRWDVVVVCGRQAFCREQGQREERTIFGMPAGKGVYPDFLALNRGGIGQDRPAFLKRTKRSQAVVLGMPSMRPASMRGIYWSKWKRSTSRSHVRCFTR